MSNQSVNASISFAAQLSIFVKGKVSVPPNAFGFGKRRDGICLEVAKFFAHGFAVITIDNCSYQYSAPQPYPRTISAFRVSFTCLFEITERLGQSHPENITNNSFMTGKLTQRRSMH
jgi:hypothetical protein